jgi:hypothetical protein
MRDETNTTEGENMKELARREGNEVLTELDGYIYEYLPKRSNGPRFLAKKIGRYWEMEDGAYLKSEIVRAWKHGAR